MRMSAPPAGAILAGKFRVERELGNGGMGVVVEATHLALDQRVAIKLLSPDLAASPEMLTRFLREGRISAKLPSEHIVRVSDVGQTEEGVPYLVMELLVGNDLATEITRKGRLPVPEAVDLLLQACEGVAAAHAAGLVHRDLKPANLFLAQRPGRPPLLKVLDFGISKELPTGAAKSLTADNTVFGTPQYMSPEQVVSSKHVDARTDQHALGMILFEMLTGLPVYDGDTPTQVLVAIATKKPPRTRDLRPDVPRSLDAAIARALAKTPDERFPDVAAFAEAIAPSGGLHAREAAGAVRLALTTRVSVAPDLPPRRDGVPTEEQVTVPRGIAAGVPQVDLTSSFDRLGQARRNRMVAVGVGAGVAVSGAIALAVLLARPAAPEPPLGAESPAPATGELAAPEPAHTATVAQAVDPAAPASASAAARPGATSTAGAKPPRGPSSSTTSTKKPGDSSLTEVFGVREKEPRKK